MLVFVELPLSTIGALRSAAPVPFATAPLLIVVGVTATAAVAPATFAWGILDGRVMVPAAVKPVLVLGVPESVTVTTVLLVRTAAAVTPVGKADVGLKLAAVMGFAYVPLDRV